MHVVNGRATVELVERMGVDSSVNAVEQNESAILQNGFMKFDVA